MTEAGRRMSDVGYREGMNAGMIGMDRMKILRFQDVLGDFNDMVAETKSSVVHFHAAFFLAADK